MAVFYLDDQDFQIRLAEPNALSIDYDRPVEGCPDVADPTSFAWVAPLSKISPGAEVVRDTCFGASDVDPAVIARARLTQGKIASGRMAMDQSRKDTGRRVIDWRFKVPGQAARIRHHQAIADVVNYELLFNSESIELETTLFRPSRNRRVEDVFRSQRQRVIRLKPHTQTARVTAWIKNMPWTDITGTRAPRFGPREPDVHFVHFYKLSYAYDEANVPHPAARCPRLDPRHQGNPNCPPPQASANEEA